MKKILAAAVSIAITGLAQAGGIERSTQSVGILFEVGRYAEFSIGSASPSVSGSFATNGTKSGNMASDYTSVSLGYKQNIGNNIDIALIIDEPVGANVSYSAGTGYPYQGSTATLDSRAYTGLMRYKLPNNVSLYGGFRSETLGGDVALTNTYKLKVANDTEYGYVAGVAYEKPEIALRTALTYNSEINHKFNDVQEGLGGLGPSLPFTTTIPKSINFEFQSGIAKDTLLFGSIRWAEWSKFDITPVGLGGASLVNLTNDITTYNLGVGRRINDKWSAAVSLGYEAPHGGISGNLAPTDGFKSIGLGVSYKMKKAKITVGARYVEIGDAVTEININPGGVPVYRPTDFSGNSALGFGVKVGYTF